MASEKRVRERIPESYEMTFEECSAMFELEELDNRPTGQMTPARAQWYGCGRKILFVSVQVSEQTTGGEWRLMRELKPFRTHVRHEGPVGKLIAKARQKYGMRYDDWKIAEVEYDTERFVCQFTSPQFRPRRIEFILRLGQTKNAITFAVVLGIAIVGGAVRADEKVTYRDSMGRIQGTVTTDRYGKTTYRDSMGRIQGTEQTDKYGKTTRRDAMGRIQGTEQTDKYGKTTWRDAQGRIQGTMTTDRYGKTTVRDAQGRIQGTATTDRYGKTTYRDAQGRIQGTKR